MGKQAKLHLLFPITPHHSPSFPITPHQSHYQLTTPNPRPWKNCLPRKRSLVPKKVGDHCCKGCGEKGTLLHCWWECKLVQPLWRTVWRFLNKLKMELSYDPGHISGENYNSKRYMHRSVHCSSIYNSLYSSECAWKDHRYAAMNR